MTQYAKDEYNKRYEIDGLLCMFCEKPAECIAHRINNNVVNNKKYGEKIISHNINLVPSCQKCNSYFSLGNKSKKIEKLVEIIKNNIHNQLTYYEIEELLIE